MARIVQTAHGFERLQAVRLGTDGIWVLAASSDTVTPVVRAIVSRVLNADTFVVTVEGPIRAKGHGLTPGEPYFIGPTPGEVVTPHPGDGPSDAILYVIDDAEMVVVPWRGGTSYVRSFVVGDLSGGVLTVTHNLRRRFVTLTLYNNSNIRETLEGRPVTATGADALTLDLTGVSVTGTWHLIVC